MLKDVTDEERVDELAEKMYYCALCDPMVDYMNWDSIRINIELQSEELFVESDTIVERASEYHKEMDSMREAINASRNE
jgi:hypothetical protein